MPKLQLYIAKSLKGYKSLVNINPEEDVRRHIGDFRNALEGVDYDCAHINIFHLLCYREQGVMITIIRTIPGKRGDHLAASLFVSDGLEIQPARILDILAELATRMSAPAMESSDIAALRELMAQDYPMRTTRAAKVDSEGRSYAFAYVGQDHPSMQDYAETGFYTPAFGEYAGVLLVPAAIHCTGIDVTPASLPKLIALDPPEETSNGFVPHIYRRVFNMPYLVPKGKTVDIVWRRGGFDSIVQKVVANNASSAKEVPPTEKAVKSISPASFYITGQRSQEPVEGAVVRVNGCTINAPVNFTYAELEHAQVEIEAKGYFTFSGKLDLATTTQALVQLKELRKVYRFELPVLTPEPEESVYFNIQTKKELDRCPVEGYEVSGDGLQEGISRTNPLIYVGGRGRRFLTWCVAVGLIGLAIGFLAGWLSFGFERHESVQAEAEELVLETESAQQPEQPQQPQQPNNSTTEQPNNSTTQQPQQPNNSTTQQPQQQPDYEAAARYLDSNRNWSAEALAEIPGMDGFFEDLNTYNFERLKNYWAPRLEASSNFAIVLRAVEGAATKPDPRRANHNPTYNSPNDTTIGWRGYTYWIDP